MILNKLKKITDKIQGFFHLGEELDAIHQELTEVREDLESELTRKESDLRHDMMVQRSALTKYFKRLINQKLEIQKYRQPETKDITEYLKQLESLAPAAYAQWRKLLDVNKETYCGYSSNHCSVKGHEVAELFKCFLEPYLNGRVLDIGCGPQPVPIYLAGYPLELISGIDPLVSFEAHPFEFVQGVAEFLPWEDGVFNVVVSATSLDHVLLLDRALKEMHRVLAENGYFVVWVGFYKNSNKYNPYQNDIQPIDKYHLFSFDKNFFEESVSMLFEIKEVMKMDSFDTISYFYCFTPKMLSDYECEKLNLYKQIIKLD
jgi:SAM-dependent methyltransferase